MERLSGAQSLPIEHKRTGLTTRLQMQKQARCGRCPASNPQKVAAQKLRELHAYPTLGRSAGHSRQIDPPAHRASTCWALIPKRQGLSGGCLSAWMADPAHHSLQGLCPFPNPPNTEPKPGSGHPEGRVAVLSLVPAWDFAKVPLVL